MNQRHGLRWAVCFAVYMGAVAIVAAAAPEYNWTVQWTADQSLDDRFVSELHPSKDPVLRPLDSDIILLAEGGPPPQPPTPCHKPKYNPHTGEFEGWEELPPSCWQLETAGSNSSGGCGDCMLLYCPHATQTFTYQVAVQACSGKDGYTSGPLQVIVAKHRPCETIPDLGMIADAFNDLVACCTSAPVECGAATLQAIGTVSAVVASGGTVAAGLATLGAPAIADMIVSICDCISCDPCDYVACEINDHGLPLYDYMPLVYLTGGDCP